MCKYCDAGDLKPYYVTTPIFYPNSVPHIGHLHSLVIADILARYSHLNCPERPVHFMTGTDEHGLKIQKAAQTKGMEPRAFCDELSEHFRNLVRKADVSATRFSRTSSKEHCDAVQHLWRQLEAKGLIYKGRHSGWYSVSDECFYPDLQVTKRSEPNGEEYHVSTETGSRVEWMEEENYKFRLSTLQPALRSHFATHEDAIYPPQHHVDILSALSEDNVLEDLSVSRPRSRLTWGVPVPGDDNHTIYVWIDALTVYLSSIGYPWTANGGDGSGSGWPPNLQIIGKDILRFHAIYFPAMLAALGLPFTERLLVHAHWTVNGFKMSKSIGNVADPITAIDEFGIDVVRWYLARIGGYFRDDVDWSREQLIKHGKEVASLLGNLYSRIASPKIRALVETHERPSLLDMNEAGVQSFLEQLRRLPALYHDRMQALQIADALNHLVAMLEEANLLMTKAKPWAVTQSTPAVRAVYWSLLECLRTCGILLQPFIPSKSANLLHYLGVPPEQRTAEWASIDAKGHIGTPVSGVVLFPMPGIKSKPSHAKDKSGSV
ncbi:hypothetical protein IEO21_02054 [Rhodonia placenta]|uniref:Probable methionine--tRNA ligase, mitochondrial n=1 Tax=Rhodonia placenta TaxID=104341 RepID=A0A8H7P8H8_9APHY|nr:hypothetical protein IEO21_02054 [Postia placenta]